MDKNCPNYSNPNIQTFNPKYSDSGSCCCRISLFVEIMKKVTLFVTRCDIEIGVNYPYNPCHRLGL